MRSLNLNKCWLILLASECLSLLLSYLPISKISYLISNRENSEFKINKSMGFPSMLMVLFWLISLFIVVYSTIRLYRQVN